MINQYLNLMAKACLPILLLASILCMFSCQQESYTTVSSTLKIDGVRDESTTLATEFRSKYIKHGFDESKLDIDNQEDRLIIKTKIETGTEALYDAILQSTHLDLYPTYNIADQEIKSIDTLLLEVDGFVPYIDEAFTSYQKEIIGKCRIPSKKQAIIDTLKSRLSHIPSLSFAWSIRKEDADNKEYYLYMINTNEHEKYDQFDQYITRTDVVENYDKYYDVTISLNNRGAKKFAELTTQASRDDFRSIAILVNDEIVTCPSVRTPILGGRLSITDKMTISVAEDLAQKLLTGGYSVDFEIIKE